MTVRAPELHPRAGLPTSVQIYEVGPRDGLQNETSQVPTAVKAAFVGRLIDAGLKTIEATSFVSPRWVPQLGDAEELLATVRRESGVRLPVLVPNRAGLDRALAAGASEIAVFAAATETFAHKNLNRGVDEVLEMFAPVVTEAKKQGVWVRSYLSMCFGDPWELHVPTARILDLSHRLLDQGSDELCIADTIGVATPGHVGHLLEELNRSGIEKDRIAVHFHDTYGQALANTLAALEAGITTIDSSAGGLGGCPFAESATGNLATEDLVWMLAGLGIETGVDLESLLTTSAWMADQLGRPSPSRLVRALTGGAR